MSGTPDSREGFEEEQFALLAAAMADPIRSRVLFALAEAGTALARETGDGPASTDISVRQISERIQEPRRRVRYHLDVLWNQGLVEVSKEKKQRGVIERYYRAARLPFLTRDEVQHLSEARQQKIVLQTLKFIFTDATEALERGTYVSRPEWAAVRLRREVDEQGWQELAALHERARIEAEDIVASARDRLRSSKENPTEVCSMNLLFEAAPRQRKQPNAG